MPGRRELNEQRSPLGLRAHHAAAPSPCGWSKDYIALVRLKRGGRHSRSRRVAGALLPRGPQPRCPHQAPFPQGCRHLWYRLLALLPAAQPWHYALKQIGGRFGSSVLSYFLFLKTLLMFNVFSFLILLVFVVALQAAYPPAKANQQSFTGFELLTGAVSTSSASLPVPPCTGRCS